jgi:hypothetical protein
MNELARVDQAGADVAAYRASTEAAAMCKEIVLATSSTIQGRRYVAVEGWQAIAVAHGCAASARDVARVDGGVRAIGEIRRMSDGQLIASAEGFVGEDEPVWFGGEGKDKYGKPKIYPKRNDYAIRAMAQTRAMSRAGRTAFAHVVVMMNAGLATTPAEEMIYVDGETGEVIDAPPQREKVPGISKIKERLNAFMREGNACSEIAEFRKLVKANKDDIKTIRDANHEYWTGDGADWEGFSAWMEGRYADLTPAAGETESFAMLRDTLEQCATTKELDAWFKLNGKYVETLETPEQDKVKALYDAKETALKGLTPLTEGAFGG